MSEQADKMQEPKNEEIESCEWESSLSSCDVTSGCLFQLRNGQASSIWKRQDSSFTTALPITFFCHDSTKRGTTKRLLK